MLTTRTINPLPAELESERKALAERVNQISNFATRVCFPGKEDQVEKINAEIDAFNAKLRAAGCSRQYGFVKIKIRTRVY